MRESESHRCESRREQACDETEVGDRCGDFDVDLLDGATPREGGPHSVDALVQPFRLVEELAQRSPWRSRGVVDVMYVDSEEGTQRSELTGQGSASSLVRLGAYPTTTGPETAALMTGLARPRTNRSSSAPKTRAIVVQMSSWLMIEYQRNFQSTSASKPG